MRGKKSGFTLIELMAVATIIAVLVLVAALNVNKAKSKSRDAQRRSDISAIAIALEGYKSDQKKYPVPDTSTWGCVHYSGNGPTYDIWGIGDKAFAGGNISATCASHFKDLLTGYYIPLMPSDPGPVMDGRLYAYSVSLDGLNFKVISRQPENPTLADESLKDVRRDGGDTETEPARCTLTPAGVYAWSIYSPGGKCY